MPKSSVATIGKMAAGKREWLARGLLYSGATFVLGRFPERDSLLVLNYHRIGNPETDPFDPIVFTGAADEFDRQVSYLKRQGLLVTLDEALAFVEGRAGGNKPRSRVLITFDDGYLDNYQAAFPILRSHGAQAVFFLATAIVGSCHVPWWDYIAYVVKTARRKQFDLEYPAALAVDIGANGVKRSLLDILNLFTGPKNTDSGRFLRELTERCEGDAPPTSQRRFLDWSEAREMIDAGMAIGSHTHSHHVLSQLGTEQQRQELIESRAVLRERLGIEASALAYPVGLPTSFTDQTRQLAQEAGYRAAFSFYGGTNLPGMTQRYDIRRAHVGYQSWPRFRVQASICRHTGRYWP